MFERIYSMLIKEFIHAFRDPRMRVLLLGVPILQTMIFGFAVSTDVRDIRTFAYDADNSVYSRELVERLRGSGYFEIADYLATEEEGSRLLDSGDAKAVFVIHPGFDATIRSGGSAPLQVLVDGTDSMSAGIVLSYTVKIAASWGEAILVERINRISGAKTASQQVSLESRAWFNENLVSRNYFVPGVIALLVMLITFMLSSMAIVREKEIGTIEQIIVSPISQFEFIIGKTVPFAIIGFIDVVLISVVAMVVFDVPLRGNVALLMGSTGLYLMSTLGLGLLISTMSSTQQQAMMTTFLFFFPAVLLSGFIFPIANMPEPVQWLTYVNPLRYFLIIVRGIFLKGIGFDVLWPQMAALLVLGSALLTAASLRFSKNIG
ncbi:MAG: ABC transporter permease [Candidatus Brocadiia bacterium]